MTGPRLTIGLPVYNGALTLRAALDCLVGQTFSDFELILADNASTDQTPDIAREYARSDRRIRYVRQATNVGISANFMFVLRQAAGQFFMWAACDDLWDPRFVETLVAALERTPTASVAFCGLQVASAGTSASSTAIYSFESLGATALWRRMVTFVCQNPSRGKANVIHGVMRRDWALQCDALARYPLFGVDLLFLLQMLAHGPFVIDRAVLFIKRPSDYSARGGARSRVEWIGRAAAHAGRIGLIAMRHPALGVPLKVAIAFAAAGRFATDTVCLVATPLARMLANPILVRRRHPAVPKR